MDCSGTKRWIQACALVASVAALAGCKSDSDDGGSGGASGVGSGGAGGTGAVSGASGTGGDTAGTGGDPMCDVPIVREDGVPCVNTGAENVDCSTADVTAPFTGACAHRDASCHRASNRARECLLGPNDPMEMEYRVMQSVTSNMPNSSGLPTLAAVAANRSRVCSSEQCLLMRMTAPRENGQRVPGDSKIDIAVGHYNCDGTYSFYGDAAAPDRPDSGLSGADRWAMRSATGVFDPAKEGTEQFQITGENPNRKPSCNAFYQEGSTDVDWELCTMGFELTAFDTSLEARDGFGAFDGAMWTHPGQYHVYALLSANDQDIIDGLGATFCQLMAFGPLPPDQRATITCSATARCMPQNPLPPAGPERTCAWVKLPDSLCPEAPGEEAMFGCHLGAQTNVNNETGYPTAVDCTMEAPTSPVENEKGQCCDPLGAGTGGLPACNAYRIVNDFAAAAIEITDEPSNELQPVCR